MKINCESVFANFSNMWFVTSPKNYSIAYYIYLTFFRTSCQRMAIEYTLFVFLLEIIKSLILLNFIKVAKSSTSTVIFSIADLQNRFGARVFLEESSHVVQEENQLLSEAAKTELREIRENDTLLVD